MKHIKNHKLSIRRSFRKEFLVLGNYGIQTVENARMKSTEFKSFKQFLQKSLKKEVFIWFRKNTLTSITAKPLEVRMGKGKGNIEDWCYKLLKGEIIVEIYIPKQDNNILNILKQGCSKLSFKSQIIKNERF